MKRNSLIMGTGLCRDGIGRARSGLGQRRAGRRPAMRPRSRPARRSIPRSRSRVVNAVDDGSGIGFSLVWLNDKDGNLWMCDADADGNVYTYSIVTGDLLAGAGGEMIGLQLTSNGGYRGRAAADRREGVRRLSERWRQGAGEHAGRARSRSRLRHLRPGQCRQLPSLQRHGRRHDLGVRAGRRPAHARAADELGHTQGWPGATPAILSCG